MGKLRRLKKLRRALRGTHRDLKPAKVFDFAAAATVAERYRESDDYNARYPEGEDPDGSDPPLPY